MFIDKGLDELLRLKLSQYLSFRAGNSFKIKQQCLNLTGDGYGRK